MALAVVLLMVGATYAATSPPAATTALVVAVNNNVLVNGQVAAPHDTVATETDTSNLLNNMLIGQMMSPGGAEDMANNTNWMNNWTINLAALTNIPNNGTPGVNSNQAMTTNLANAVISVRQDNIAATSWRTASVKKPTQVTITITA
jgi:hypothetical protein